MAQMQVFVSHSHEDDAFCRAVVEGLRGGRRSLAGETSPPGPLSCEERGTWLPECRGKPADVAPVPFAIG
jgi:hypothetical protein